MRKVLITYAIKDEVIPINLKNSEVKYIITGVGKTRAAMKLTEAICLQRPDLVLNIGTSGSLDHGVGEVFVCNRFIDRDYQLVTLPGIEYELDFSSLPEIKAIMQKWDISPYFVGTCNTGDGFVTEADSVNGNVVDMEAFALATVCKEFNIPFLAVKYITDIIGHNSVKHWEDKLADAREALKIWFKDK